ncbi:PAS domain-containing protein, partial [Anaeromusa sp.]|uniref:PAS domain-containing protein n=1 Tax=Anaeromusa sp. TaxID=1872520 RepID=UPI0026360147
MSLLASHTEEMFYTILDNLREAVNVVDTKGYITYVNPSSANYASARVEDMIGKHITEYYPHAALLDVIRDQKPLLDQKMAQGNGRTFIVNAVPLYRQGEFYGGVSTFRDITELDELARTLEYLENELALSQGSGIFESFIGADGSLRNAIFKAQRSIASVGGPRHSVILG